MIEVTDTIKKAYEESTTQYDKIILDNKEYYINNVQYCDDCYLDGNIFGTAIARTLDFEIENIVDLEKKEFEYLTGIRTENGIEWISLGNFITQEAEPDELGNVITVSAMDYMLKSNVEYKTELDYGSGTVTILQVLQEACENAGITLATTDFANATLYQSLLTIAEQNDNQILYPEVFKGVNFIDLSNLGLTSFSGMEKFSFDVNTVIDLSNNKLSDISSISSFVNKNEITIVLLFNEISNIEEASNFVYGMQNLKTKYINEKPVIGQNLLINDDYSEIFDYTISKDVSSSHSMSMLSSSIEAFNEYGTYKITFTYKTNSQISHSIKIQYGNISLRNQTYNQEAGYPFSKDDIIFNGIEVSDYTYQLRNVPQGDLEIGTFNVTYDIYKKEDGEKVVSLSQTVVVADTISPTITIIGNEEVYTYLGNNYVDKGARAYDSYDAQPIVVTEGSVDTTKIGEYSITYYAKDSSGNESVRRIRIVNVIYYPISGIQVDVEKSYYTGETANLNITPIVPLGKENYLDPNLKYFLYIKLF